VAEVALLDVTKSFDDTPVLHELSLHVPDGEFCVVLGPSGCGKSTLLRIIAGLEDVDRGSVHIGGKDVTPEVITEIIDYTLSHDEPIKDYIWMGLLK